MAWVLKVAGPTRDCSSNWYSGNEIFGKSESMSFWKKGGRRPVWQTSLHSRVLLALKKRLKPLAALTAGIVVVAGLWLFFSRDNIIIETFDVPKGWVDQGLSGDVLARQIRDALEKMEIAGHNNLQTDSFVVHADPDPIPDIKIGETGIGLRTFFDDARAVLNRHISVDFIVTSAFKSEPRLGSIVVTLRVSRRGNPGQLVTLTGPFNDPQSMTLRAAEALLRKINPFALGLYLYGQSDVSTAEQVWNELANDPTHSARQQTQP